MSSLEKVLERLDQQPGGAVVFDLDSTLFDNGPRTVRIMLEWPTTISRSWSQVSRRCRAIASLTRWLKMPLASRAGTRSGSSHSRRFGSSASSPMSTLTLTSLWTARRSSCARAGRGGAHVVYLTGRDVPGMWTGTCNSLGAFGFPVGVPGVELVLKPNFEMDDSLFKGNVIPQIDAYCAGGVVATFENEAKNLIVMAEAGLRRSTSCWTPTGTHDTQRAYEMVSPSCPISRMR